MSGTFRQIPIRSGDGVEAEGPGCSDAEPYALRVIGDSMEPEFRDGHIVIVDPVMPPRSDAFVVADYAGDTLLRQYVERDGRRWLVALNAAHPAVEVTGPLRIRGVVVQRAGRRRREHKHYY